jgi:tetratricopeptide (TPR) repeat protein
LLPEFRPEPVLGEGPIHWGRADGVDVASPSLAQSLIERAIESRPAHAPLQVKLADLRLDRYDFAAAAAALEVALRLDPDLPGIRPRLGRCYNYLCRHEQALAVLAAVPSPEYERAVALAASGKEAESEAEFNALLGARPGHARALRQLDKMLRRQGRLGALLDLCDGLRAKGVSHAQLFYTWGAALALAGRDPEARALLLDRARLAELPLPLPDGFPDIAAFNAALAEELLGNPHRLGEFPVEDEANRGSSRVHALFAGRRPELVHKLLDSLQNLIAAHAPRRRASFDPWLDARPGRAHLKAWGLIQSGGDYEEWHSHPGGWMSGVYYVRVPGCVDADGDGPGCIEFGPPTALGRARPGFVPVWRHAPRAGHLLLAPSHYTHRTIPTGAADHRISFAFDVVPEA